MKRVYFCALSLRKQWIIGRRTEISEQSIVVFDEISGDVIRRPPSEKMAKGFNEKRIISLFGGNSRHGSSPESAAIYIKPDPGTIATFYSYTKRGGARCTRALAVARSLDRATLEVPLAELRQISIRRST